MPTALLILTVCLTQSQPTTDRDTFGIRMIYPTRAGTRLWTSAHWDKHNYQLTARLDPNDPQGISGKRGDGTLSIADGVLTMAGSQPRFYIYPYADLPWRDVEVTAYYMRVADNAASYAGMVAGVRSGPDGHTEASPCDANTYYGRMRHDGAFDFDKELKHPRSSARDRLAPASAWPGGKLPYNRWIGWKLIAYNTSDTAVKLEIYRDLTEGQNGGSWEKLIHTTDDGGWFASTDCPDQQPVGGHSDMRVLTGGVVFIRNTDVQDARYRWVSVREIQPAN